MGVPVGAEKPQAQARAGFPCSQERSQRPEDRELSGVAVALGPTCQLLLFLCFKTLAAQTADTCPGEMDLNFWSLKAGNYPLIDHKQYLGLNPPYASSSEDSEAQLHLQTRTRQAQGHTGQRGRSRNLSPGLSNSQACDSPHELPSQVSTLPPRRRTMPITFSIFSWTFQKDVLRRSNPGPPCLLGVC